LRVEHCVVHEKAMTENNDGAFAPRILKSEIDTVDVSCLHI